MGFNSAGFLDFIFGRYFGSLSDRAEEQSEQRKQELTETDPGLVKDWDHKDWRHNDTIMTYWRGFNDAVDEIWAEIGAAIERSNDRLSGDE